MPGKDPGKVSRLQLYATKASGPETPDPEFSFEAREGYRKLGDPDTASSLKASLEVILV